VDDAAITAEVKARLVAERPANLVSVNVDTRQGVVQLRGTVPSLEDKFTAERIARRVSGVRSVDNDLMLEQAAARDASPAASPGILGRHTVTGEVTDVDASRGRIELKTDQGDMELAFPPSAVRTMRRGDRVVVDLSIRSAR
jgi:hyperosmotically inducible protein